MSLAQMKEQIVQMTIQERAELQAFISSLEDGTLSDAWSVEISKRQADFETGQVEFLTHEQVFGKN